MWCQAGLVTVSIWHLYQLVHRLNGLMEFCIGLIAFLIAMPFVLYLGDRRKERLAGQAA